MVESYKPQVTAEDRVQLATAFDATDVEGEPTLSELRRAVRTEANSEFASMGEAIRSDLTGQLDADLVESSLNGLRRQLEGAESVREVGVPERVGPGDAGVGELYRELIDPVWPVYHHLVEIGFFESLSENLPAFTPEHIDHTARRLLTTEGLTADLSGRGFDEREQTALLMDVTNNDTRLSRWVPTRDIPEGVEFDVDYVPPLYHRAIGGGLLWLKALDRHLTQKEILLTEEILDDAFWRSKAVLGGTLLFLRAVEEIATEGQDLTDEQLVAALSGGAAISIVNQEELMQEVFWIHEEKRAPSSAR
ncbi:MAG: hypothetical protein PPP58_01740 [Natronomonas sp.]